MHLAKQVIICLCFDFIFIQNSSWSSLFTTFSSSSSSSFFGSSFQYQLFETGLLTLSLNFTLLVVVFDSTNDPPIVGGTESADPPDWPLRLTFASRALASTFANNFNAHNGFGTNNTFSYSGSVTAASSAGAFNATVDVSLDSSVAFGGFLFTDPTTMLELVICVGGDSFGGEPLGCTASADVPCGCLELLAVPPICMPAADIGGGFGVAACDGGNGTLGGGTLTFRVTGASSGFSYRVLSVPLQFDSFGERFDELSDASSRIVRSTSSLSASVSVGSGASSVVVPQSSSLSSDASVVALELLKSSLLVTSDDGTIRPGAEIQCK